MEIISSLGLIQLMIATSIALAVVIVWGVYYPKINRQKKEIKHIKEISFGSNEMFEQLNYYISSGNFNEGIVFAYNLLRKNLSSMEKYPNDESLTEFETIKKTSSDVSELSNVSSLLMSAYKQYELARFRAKTNSKNLDIMNKILRNITKNNNFIIQVGE